MKLVWSLVVLAVLLVAADRVGVVVAEGAVAAQVEKEFSERPDVSIEGFPFLTQAVSGRYSSVRLSGRNLAAGGERLSEFDATLSGLSLPLSDALSGSVARVPVESLRARVVLSYADLQSRLRDRRLSLAPGPDGLLRVSGSVTVLGRTVSASALSSVALSGTNVVVTAQRFETGAGPADRVLTSALGKRLDFTVKIGKLPYGLTLTGVQIRPEGVVAEASARNAVLTR